MEGSILVFCRHIILRKLSEEGAATSNTTKLTHEELCNEPTSILGFWWIILICFGCCLD